MTGANPFLEFTDADLKDALMRALRTIVLLGLGLAVAVGFAAGWRSAVMLLVGAMVSATGLYEWQQLISLINAKLDNARSPRSTVWVVTMFFFRLALAAVILYASVRYLHGSLYALIAGLGLAMIALTIEAVRLVRS
ncbi:hypothetical protein C7378_0389 [Acidipila rosea]|uniref:ATP synthase I subunit n=1 Tax=Acidipila rosea TaxID=768535 RepID=A0A4R1LAE9_9BACT|nr:hypothetical protein C7378_0389 [Acidipila rosea]